MCSPSSKRLGNKIQEKRHTLFMPQWNVTPLIWALGRELEIVEIYSSLIPLPPLFSPKLAYKVCIFACMLAVIFH